MLPFNSIARAVVGVVLVVAVAAACGGSGGGGGGDEQADLGPAGRLMSEDKILEHAKQFKGKKLTVIVPDPLDEWLAPGTKNGENASPANVRAAFDADAYARLAALKASVDPDDSSRRAPASTSSSRSCRSTN